MLESFACVLNFYLTHSSLGSCLKLYIYSFTPPLPHYPYSSFLFLLSIVRVPYLYFACAALSSAFSGLHKRALVTNEIYFLIPTITMQLVRKYFPFYFLLVSPSTKLKHRRSMRYLIQMKESCDLSSHLLV